MHKFTLCVTKTVVIFIDNITAFKHSLKTLFRQEYENSL